MTRRGISDVIRYDAPQYERYGVSPEKWIDFVALKGETADNLPGIRGVGDKTAAQLVNKYGDVEQMISHADELAPKLRDAIKDHADQVRINKELGHLLDDVPLEIEIGKLCLEPWDEARSARAFHHPGIPHAPRAPQRTEDSYRSRACRRRCPRIAGSRFRGNPLW